MSQRVRKTLENLENVEGKLNDTLTKMGLPLGGGDNASSPQQMQLQARTPSQNEAKQEEDMPALEKELKPQTSSQADIDALFD